MAAESQERRYLRMIADEAVIHPDRKDDIGAMRSIIVLCGIWAKAGLMPPEPPPFEARPDPPLF